MPTTPSNAHAIALGELPESVPATTKLDTGPVNPLHNVMAQLQVVVGTIDLTVGDLMALRGGQIIALGHRLDEPVDVVLEGQVVARGELVAVDDQFAIRITQLPLVLSP